MKFTGLFAVLIRLCVGALKRASGIMSNGYPGFDRNVKEPNFKQQSKNHNRKVDPGFIFGEPFPFSVDLPDNQMIFGG